MLKEELISSYRQDLKLQGVAPSTLVNYPTFVKGFQTWLGNKPIEGAERADFKAYIGYLRQEKGLKVKSIKLYFSVLTSFYDYLIEEEIIDHSPLDGISKRYLRQFKDPASERRALSIQEAQRLLSVILDTRDRVMILMLLKTGIRLHELCDLDLEDVDLEHAIFRLKESAKITNRTRFMDDELINAMKRWLPLREKLNHQNDPALWLSNYRCRISKPEVYKKFKIHAKAAKLEGISPDNCMHTFATWLLSTGMSRKHVQMLRGDVGREAIDCYNHPTEKQLRESYLAHMPRLGI